MIFPNLARMPMTSDFEGARVLITGGLGFIGSNLARRLAGLGADLTLVDSLIPETGANTFNIESVQDHPRLSVRTVDVRDVLAMQRLVRGQSIIFNLAGQVSHMFSGPRPVRVSAITVSDDSRLKAYLKRQIAADVNRVTSLASAGDRQGATRHNPPAPSRLKVT